ncbi:hypothetical protein EGW08_023258 [Elysia chlorotica]|uniref:CCHC-type domain-containing protein n=1 Tax=Elysia chlorotica TaxID=188477 RepID=A0A3S1AQC2_ELYCH|nr:hypothetical protein EGW08_023258 [Elysia chlorotica]
MTGPTTLEKFQKMSVLTTLDTHLFGQIVDGAKQTVLDSHSQEDLESYLKRFERLAITNGRAESTWADRLRDFLTRKALDVYRPKTHGVNGREKEKRSLCFKCGSPRHVARFCNLRDKVAAANARDTQVARGQDLCYICQSPQLWARKCPKRREREVAASALRLSTNLRAAVSEVEGDKNDRGLAVVGTKAGDSIMSPDACRTERSIILCTDDQKKMYQGRYMDSGELDGHKISVLRDTSCTFSVVKRLLLPPGSLTGENRTNVLMDGTERLR